ncbi:hypothetical protein Pan44_26200 [Caulifigura coniformis]|uniref:Uncharacterized protein n=1 Tax=Caulifigura coniformis TaxID=2527983 RepID=A0A517SES2_9PLAN|nr:hypothetical protein [Caulifigura coniformis]QDT54587.1 hypothetical protein Pan44_26200 [Caulifigura coniformis]
MALLLLLVLPLFLVVAACQAVLVAGIEFVIWIAWLPRGKDILLVYSNSPHWQEFFEREMLPRLAGRVVTLNWSERKSWINQMTMTSLTFRLLAGSRDFNPIAFHFRPFRMHATYRFLQPIRAWRKSGSRTELDALMARFAAETGV